jgi:hypothetical protein
MTINSTDYGEICDGCYEGVTLGKFDTLCGCNNDKEPHKEYCDECLEQMEQEQRDMEDEMNRLVKS